MATRKPLATSAQRRAYRSVTTRAQRQALRAAQPSKRSYARIVGSAGAQIRQSRLAQGLNPNDGTKRPRRRDMKRS